MRTCRRWVRKTLGLGLLALVLYGGLFWWAVLM